MKHNFSSIVSWHQDCHKDIRGEIWQYPVKVKDTHTQTMIYHFHLYIEINRDYKQIVVNSYIEILRAEKKTLSNENI